MSKFARKGKPPPGYDYLEPVLEALENELRDKVNEPHEGKRKVESLWPVHQINWQRTRYVYDMHYKYKKIDKKVWDYCCRNKIIDENLAKKWRKPGCDLGAPLCGGAFTSFKRVVSRNDGRGWSIFLFWGRSDRVERPRCSAQV